MRSGGRGCVEIAPVEGLGSQVGAVRPDDGPELRVDRRKGKEDTSRTRSPARTSTCGV